MKFNLSAAKHQIYICNKIIKDINAGNYRNASVLIRFYLNDSSYYWYKNIDSIIQDQISNLFLDIEQEFKNNYTVGFFQHIISELEYEIKQYKKEQVKKFHELDY